MPINPIDNPGQNQFTFHPVPWCCCWFPVISDPGRQAKQEELVAQIMALHAEHFKAEAEKRRR